MNTSSSPSFLFLHGALGSGRMWAPIIESLQPLSGDVLCYTPDLPGHGSHSIPVHADAEFDDIAEQFFRGLKCPFPAFIVAYSMGARLALSMLLRHPDHFAGGVLIGVHPGLSTQAERAERRHEDDIRLTVLEQEGLEAFVQLWEQMPVFASQQTLSGEISQRQRRMRTGHRPEFLLPALRALQLSRQPDYLPLLPKLPVSLCFMAGAHDKKFTAMSQRLADLSPRFSFAGIPLAGHNTILENPEETTHQISLFSRQILSDYNTGDLK